MQNLTITPADLAALLGYRSANAFLTARRKLEAKGFPSRLPGGNYYLPAVRDWMRRHSDRQSAAASVVKDAAPTQRDYLDTLYAGARA